MKKVILSIFIALLAVSCTTYKATTITRKTVSQTQQQEQRVAQVSENDQKSSVIEFAGQEKKEFPAIELKKAYAWRNFHNAKLVGYGYYVFTQLENGKYSGVQINSYWDTNWNITATLSKDLFLINTPQPWNENWMGKSFDGKTIRGTYILSGEEHGFEFDIVDTNQNDSLIMSHVKPN